MYSSKCVGIPVKNNEAAYRNRPPRVARIRCFWHFEMEHFVILFSELLVYVSIHICMYACRCVFFVNNLYGMPIMMALCRREFISLSDQSAITYIYFTRSTNIQYIHTFLVKVVLVVVFESLFVLKKTQANAYM